MKKKLLKTIITRTRYTIIFLLIPFTSIVITAKAETITISRGSGIIWEGMPFNVNLSGPIGNSYSMPYYGLLSVSYNPAGCVLSHFLQKISGYTVYPLAPGVGLIPRATGTVTYYTLNEQPVTINALLGLPETKGIGESSHLTAPSGSEWCIPASMEYEPYKYSVTSPRTVNIKGSWVIVADGTQKSSEVNLKPIYAGSFGNKASANLNAVILPANIKLRISNLACTVNTPSQINFGPLAQELTPGAELGLLAFPLITQCNQDSDRINANINLQFRAVSGLYQNSPTKLSLNAGGGYITGEIDKGVTGSGRCNATAGVPFDNQAIRIGSINNTQASLTLTNQITWRLCSGGKDLPLGNVDATAEMLVTFN